MAKAKRKVSEKIERLEREAEEIKRECFDGMETRRCAVTTFACEERDEIFRDPVAVTNFGIPKSCLLYTSPSPRDGLLSRMPSSA